MEFEKNKILVFGIEQNRGEVFKNIAGDNLKITYSSKAEELFLLLNQTTFDLILLLNFEIESRIFMSRKGDASAHSYRESQKELQLITHEIKNLKYEIFNQHTSHESRQTIGKT